jgi:hypothetical protein
MLEAFPLCPGAVPVAGALCNTVSGAAGNLAGSAASAGIGTVFSEAARWVASGAVWLIAQVGRAMSGTTSVELDAGWFRAHEAVMASLAAAVVLPMACCAAIGAVYRQSASTLLRTFLVHLPLSLLLTGVAVTLVRMSLAVTDAMSATVLSSAGVDTTNLFTGLFKFLAPSAVVTGPVPGFVVFLGGLFVAVAALTLWLELVVRAAAVSVAVLFLPLALAALVWPSVAHWCRRLADTLVALVLSKFVVAAVLSLAAGAGAGGLGVSGSGNGGEFASVVTGIALLLIAVLAPFTLLRLVPAVEAGAVAHLESTRHRLKSAAASPVSNGRNLALDLARQPGSRSDEEQVGSVGTVGSAGAAASAAAIGPVGLVGSAGAVATVGSAGAAAGAAAAGSAGTGSSIGSADAVGTGTGGGVVISMTPGDAEASMAFSRIRPDDGHDTRGTAQTGDGGGRRGTGVSPASDRTRPARPDITDDLDRE